MNITDEEEEETREGETKQQGFQKVEAVARWDVFSGVVVQDTLVVVAVVVVDDVLCCVVLCCVVLCCRLNWIGQAGRCDQGQQVKQEGADDEWREEQEGT
jgi:hypothetical protein